MTVAPDRLRLQHVADRLDPSDVQRLIAYGESLLDKRPTPARKYRLTTRGFRVHDGGDQVLTDEVATAIIEDW